ncbi:hypothetical protein [Steroidobacter agaridevorans]|uniref:hypothetical protein n=1 Tax=Steroidobacter agaridevorans TaxID=2695856 RepID=UPI00137B4CC6|nr:hypothetical protein [Steroidobacter agaridevorans]
MPRARAKAPASDAAPWWLTDGDEECLGCGQLYIYEMEFRCPECEMTTCIHCRRRRPDGRLVCVSCLDAGGPGDGG